ncbi:CE1759 family FMN reductase [Citricoccus muralis]|uniref:NAD(P)H-dependent oxidoreductase n=1 Tax=Citricoccus muralis TaxID=169134 RepID=A0ABY8HAA8_9MICC|nr:CE1759 family FMN reductase [Citricoccus muralis]WFP17635.1 NAD(P)H-dependent oxidoreductase [Citricoccus muralis]
MTMNIAVISAGSGNPSSTGMLADRLQSATEESLSGNGTQVNIRRIELRELALDIAEGHVSTSRSEKLDRALRQVETADALIAVTPTYKGSYAGLFKAFIDLLDDDAMQAMPVLLGATGGTARHSLMIDFAMRPLFTYLKAQIAPLAVFAATDDWGLNTGQFDDGEIVLSKRITEAGRQFGEMLTSSPAQRRPKKQPTDAQTPFEVTPFEQLLAGR